MGQALNEEIAKGLEYQTELMTGDVFDKYWPYISAELDKVPHIWERHYTKEYIYEGALSGEFGVWGIGPRHQIRLVVFTKILDCPAARILQITLALGNDLEGCLPNLTATLEKLAKEMNCQYCEIIGREGWQKLLPEFKKTGIVLSRKLEHFKVQ